MQQKWSETARNQTINPNLMRVLLISKSIPNSFKGGIQTHVWELASHLEKIGVSVTILTGGSLRAGARARMIEGRKVISLPYLPLRKFPIVGIGIDEFAFNVAVARWVKRHHKDFDIIHQQGRSGYLIPYLRINVPVVNTVHRLWSVEGQWAKHDFNNKMIAGFYKWMTCRFEEKAIRKSRAIIGISRSTLTEIQAKLNIQAAKLNLVYNGASSNEAIGQAIEPRKQLLFVGRLCQIKGVFPLLKAFSQVDEVEKLIMIGDGPARPQLVELIQQLGLAERVDLIGSQEQAVVRKLMRESYALILPSFHESQGIVLMENNLEGRPVLATSVAGIKEVVQHRFNGLLFPSHSITEMVEAIKELFSDAKAAQKMGLQGRHLVKHKFSWDSIAEQTLKIYKSIV